MGLRITFGFMHFRVKFWEKFGMNIQHIVDLFHKEEMRELSEWLHSIEPSKKTNNIK